MSDCPTGPKNYDSTAAGELANPIITQLFKVGHGNLVLDGIKIGLFSYN